MPTTKSCGSSRRAASGCVGFNPLEEIRIGTEYEVGDAQNLATLIVDPDGKGLQDHWQVTAQTLIAGCIIHLLYKAVKFPQRYQNAHRIFRNPLLLKNFGRFCSSEMATCLVQQFWGLNTDRIPQPLLRKIILSQKVDMLP
jgi:Type IV secretory system Conjugative DNA transfer